MNPILLTISNSVSAMPTASAATPVPTARGGFAATFAVAQGASTASQRTPNAGPSALTSTSTTAATDPVAPLPPPQGPQPKKQLSAGSAVAASLTVGMNLPIPLPDASLSLASLSAPATPAQNVNPGGTVQSGFPSGASVATVAPLSSLADQGAAQSGANQATGKENGRANSMPGEAVSATVPPNLISSSLGPATSASSSPVFADIVSPNNNPSDSLVPPSTVADVSKQNDTAPATAQPQLLATTSTASGSNGSGDFVAATDSLAKASRQEIQLPVGSSGRSVLKADQAVTPSAPAPIFVANASSDTGSANTGSAPASPFGSATSAQSIPANSVNVTAPGTAPSAVNLSGQVESGSSAQSANPENLSPDLNRLSPFILEPFAAPNVTAAVTNPMVHGTGQGAGTPAAAPSAALPAGPDSGNGLPASSQTPFSVFFSGSGPGTESAVSALPKLILPTSGSALRDSHTSLGGTISASPQSNNAQGGNAQNASSQNGKGSTAGGAGAGLPAAQALHRNGDASAAGVLAGAQAPAPPLPAAPISAAVILSTGGQPPPAADSLPKPGPLPAGAPDRPVGAGPEPAAVVPGPVQMAQLVTRVGQSETRIGMSTSAFGGVEVRTVVHANDVGLIIGSEKGDLRTLLANDIPVITSSLQQQNLRLNSVNFMQGFAFSNNASGGGDPQPRPFVPARSFTNSGSAGAAVNNVSESHPAVEYENGNSNLSILA